MAALLHMVDMSRAKSRQLVVLALLFTLLNAAKPLVLDDSAYYYYAKQITRDPLRPYAFEMFWYETPEPANSILAPPVLPYWWSIALGLFGERPFFWKLWLFPFSLLFVCALQALLARFARGVATPLLWMTVLSPTYLPNLNLMLDVPALALGLIALVLFFRATAKGSYGLAVLAGLVTGLAMETKYTAFLVPAVMLFYAILFGRPRFGVTALCAAVSVFVSWESFIAIQHGASHFLCNLGRQASTLTDKLALALALVTLAGGMCAPILLVALTALGIRRRLVGSAAVLTAVGFALVACLELPAIDKPFFQGFSGQGERITPRLEFLVFGTLGAALFRAVAAVIARLLSSTNKQPTANNQTDRSWAKRLQTTHARMDSFLVGWFGLEVLGYFALSPFPSPRRMMGLVAVGTLLVGRLAARTCQTPERRAVLRGAAIFGVLLGLVIYGVDLREANADKQIVDMAADFVQTRQPGGTVWYIGHWALQHYAERAGMKPVAPNASTLQRGDWLVIPDGNIDQQSVRLEENAIEFITRLTISDWPPLHTRRRLYTGQSPVAHFEGPRSQLAIYRVTKTFLVQSALPGDGGTMP